MSRNLLPILMLSGLCLLLLGIVWASHNPDSEWLRRAEAWPGIGSAALWFREQYRPEPAIWTGPPLSMAGNREVLESTVEVMGPPWKGVPEWVWAPRGTVMRTGPDSSSSSLGEVTALTNLARLERREDWFRVWRHGRESWVFLPGYRDDDGPPLGNAPEPPLPRVAREPESEKLGLALGLLGATPREAALGPYSFYTDVEEGRLVEVLDRVVDQVEGLYARRYGLTPLGHAKGAVVLYAEEGSYRRLQTQSRRLRGLTPTGHTSHGIVALYRGERTRAEVASTLVHELVHLLNLRSLGPALPPWLDEGLAGDLGSINVDIDGNLDPSRLGGLRLDWPGRVDLIGSLAAVWSVRNRLSNGAQPPLQTILSRDWESFVRGSPDRARPDRARPDRARPDRAGQESYETTGLFVRFLLETTAFRDGFRSFLASVSRGEDPSGEALRSQLSVSWESLDSSFALWVMARAAELESAPGED